MTFSSLMLRVDRLAVRPSTVSRRCSMNTTAIGLPTLARVVRSISSPPALSSVTCTSGPFWPVLAVALVSWSPVTMTSRFSMTLPISCPRSRGRRSWRRWARGRCGRNRSRIDQAVFERRDLAEDVLDLGGVLHAGQLHHDAVEALALHDGLGDAELVDAIAQRGDVGGDGEVAALAHLLRASARSRPPLPSLTTASRHARSGCTLLIAARTLPGSASCRQQHAQAVRDVRVDGERVDVGERDVRRSRSARRKSWS